MINELRKKVRKFAEERDWEQFHNPKDLATALSIEVSELQELLLWVKTEDSITVSKQKENSIREEVGDILIYLLRFCDVLGIDPIRSAEDKLEANAKKYPVAKSKGNSKKYTEL